VTSRLSAWLLAAGLAVAVCVAVAARATADPVRRMPQTQLERTARHVAVHNHRSCYGCASLRMKRLAAELVWRAFPPRSREWGLCVAIRESGLNFAAVSPDNDFGIAQIHTALWRQFDARRLVTDPVYSVASFVRLSDHGRNRQPWGGGRYAC